MESCVQQASIEEPKSERGEYDRFGGFICFLLFFLILLLASDCSESGEHPHSCDIPWDKCPWETEVSRFTYDAGRLMTVERFHPDGSPFRTTQFSYDEDGNLLSQKETDSYGDLRETYAYSYDAHGNMLTKVRCIDIEYYPRDCHTNTYKYDDMNILILDELDKYSDGKVDHYYKYWHDEHGNFTMKTSNTDEIVYRRTKYYYSCGE